MQIACQLFDIMRWRVEERAKFGGQKVDIIRIPSILNVSYFTLACQRASPIPIVNYIDLMYVERKLKTEDFADPLNLLNG